MIAQFKDDLADTLSSAEAYAAMEAAYRRGYQQGAYAALQAVDENGLQVPNQLHNWVDRDLFNWRYKMKDTKHGGHFYPPDAPAPELAL